jgi:hypothetical protein
MQQNATKCNKMQQNATKGDQVRSKLKAKIYSIIREDEKKGKDRKLELLILNWQKD